MEAPIVSTKHCTRCTVEQDVEQFRFKTAKNKNGSVRKWRYSWCNTCCRQLALEYSRGLRVRSVCEVRLTPSSLTTRNVRSVEELRKRGAARARKWRAAHHRQVIEEAKVRKHLRRARLKQCEGAFSLSEWRSLLKAYQYTCLACGAKRGDYGVKITIDHIVPVVANGTNWIWNLQPLCVSCNASKGANTMDYRTDGFYLRMVSADGAVTDLGNNFFSA